MSQKYLEILINFYLMNGFLFIGLINLFQCTHMCVNDFVTNRNH